MTVHVLAVADSDAYLKWAVHTLSALGPSLGGEPVEARAVVLRSPVLPTPAQVAAATAGSTVGRTEVVSVWQLHRLLRRRPPDVLLVAATGPVAQVVGRLAQRARRRPALVTGLPGLALPATAVGVRRRTWCDAFVVHSRAERSAYGAAFAAAGTAPAVVLSHLPFFRPAGRDARAASGSSAPVVFAAQPSVPAARHDRVRLLAGLAGVAAAGHDVVVKLRATTGERQTHHEPHPYADLWEQEHARLGHPRELLRFATGAMSDWLRPGATLVTVSSTAALEAIAAGVPTALVADLGVADALLNPPFAGSGLMTHLADLPAALERGLPAPDPSWADEHGFHPEPSELPAALARLVARSRASVLPAQRVPVPRRSVLRLVVPTTLAARAR
ncbi:DUF6716 putative glycosyltransferase [Cellulomonas alba]|uniref:D-inositol 3-phosphate glycosyltransferase n=1 Tax=Cellulomonas alba TaxID=3053467 RepID=A0ABT7SK75_9CELL|nr:DUF6716 putative glycosyltransferase [Cellulomonas alba]MDM7856596.1 hypothetical protein [Cellulomonas alba]